MKNFSNKLVFGGFYSPPFMDFDENQDLQGPLIDVACLLSRDFSLIPEIKNLDQKTLNSFNESSIHIGLGIFETPFREPLGEFSHPLFLFELQGLGYKDYGFAGINELTKSNLRCGVKEGEIGYDFLLATFGKEWIDGNCEVIPASSDKDTWMLLLDHRSDIVLCDSLTLTNRRKEISGTTIFSFREKLMDIKMGLLINKESPLPVEKINNWLFQFLQKKEYTSFIDAVSKNGLNSFKPFEI